MRRVRDYGARGAGVRRGVRTDAGAGAGGHYIRGGVEIKIRDQDAALLNLAKYFKLLAPEDKSDKEDGGTEIVITGGLPE